MGLQRLRDRARRASPPLQSRDPIGAAFRRWPPAIRAGSWLTPDAIGSRAAQL